MRRGIFSAKRVGEVPSVIENGSSWVEPLLKNMADLYKKMPQDFLEDPIEVIKRNIYISPFWEEDLWALVHFVDSLVALRGTEDGRRWREANLAADERWKPPGR